MPSHHGKDPSSSGVVRVDAAFGPVVFIVDSIVGDLLQNMVRNAVVFPLVPVKAIILTLFLRVPIKPYSN